MMASTSESTWSILKAARPPFTTTNSPLIIKQLFWHMILLDSLPQALLMSSMRHKRRRLNSSPTVQPYIYMSTRSKQPESASGQPEGTKPKAIWLQDDERFLVSFLKTRKAEAGDAGNFKPITWVAAAVEMEKHRRKGAPKTDKSCLAKWAAVRNPANIHHRLVRLPIIQYRSRRHITSFMHL
jgi:hypothetical protein